MWGVYIRQFWETRYKLAARYPDKLSALADATGRKGVTTQVRKVK
jgi:hypothetical protein